MTIAIRAFSHEDLPAVMTIQKESYGSALWDEGEYARIAGDPGGIVLVAEVVSFGSPEIGGFAVAHWVMEQAEVRNLAVAPDYQRQGIGRALLGEIHQRLVAAGIRRVFLEVRPSNGPARALYSSGGYIWRSGRRDYYRNPAEDALVLWRELP